jgi:hypothetical protein
MEQNLATGGNLGELLSIPPSRVTVKNAVPGWLVTVCGPVVTVTVTGFSSQGKGCHVVTLFLER